MKEETQMIECPECEGEGTVYIDTSHSCTVYPIGECCGGCGHSVECEECYGVGYVEEEREVPDETEYILQGKNGERLKESIKQSKEGKH